MPDEMRCVEGTLVVNRIAPLTTSTLSPTCLQLFTQAVSLGDVDSLACHPASTMHSFVSAVVRAQNGITEGLIRLSVGIEHSDDLMANLEQALRQVG